MLFVWIVQVPVFPLKSQWPLTSTFWTFVALILWKASRDHTCNSLMFEPLCNNRLFRRLWPLPLAPCCVQPFSYLKHPECFTTFRLLVLTTSGVISGSIFTNRLVQYGFNSFSAIRPSATAHVPVSTGVSAWTRSPWHTDSVTHPFQMEAMQTGKSVVEPGSGTYARWSFQLEETAWVKWFLLSFAFRVWDLSQCWMTLQRSVCTCHFHTPSALFHSSRIVFLSPFFDSTQRRSETGRSSPDQSLRDSPTASGKSSIRTAENLLQGFLSLCYYLL